MATDAVILTAARELAARAAALKEAEATHARLGAELQAAAMKVDACRKTAKECEQRLLQLAHRVPAEPAPKVEPVVEPKPGLVELPPKVMAEPSPLPRPNAPVPTIGRNRGR